MYAQADGLASGDRRDDRDIGPGPHRRIEALQEADVLAVDVQVHEPAELAGAEQTLRDTRIAALEVTDDVGDRSSLCRHLARAIGQGAELGGDTYLDAHRRTSSSARSTSSIFGLTVA